MYQGTFTPPGPGSWELEQTHMLRPVTRWLGAVYPDAHMRGFREAFARYGALLEGMDVAMVDGFMYGRTRPVGAPPDAKGTPPKLIFKALLLLHPELRRRIRTCREAFETKLWRADVARWDDEWRPLVEKRNAALAAIVPDALSDANLVEHLEHVRVALDDGYYRHHALNVTVGLPVGDFLAQTAEWTGKPLAELLGLMKGSTPVSVGAVDEMDRLVRALRADANAAARIARDDDAGATLAALREEPGELGAAARAYLDKVGLRMLSGYDVADYYALEVPVILLRAIRASLEGSTASTHETHAARVANVRDAVPDAHRNAFDELLEEARFVSRIRDEKTYLNDLWTVGIARRALLDAGRRLAARGRIERAEHALDLTPKELVSVLGGGEGPSAGDLAKAAHWRATAKPSDAPEWLGSKPGAPPPVEWLPPPAARAMRAIQTLMKAMFDVDAARATRDTVGSVRGLAASPGRVEGPARLVTEPAHFAKVHKGDVLIAATTCPSYNVLLPVLGGIVTDRGGLLSHAAIVAREYGLPAVVGTRAATKTIPDGARVRVDGGTGLVEVLG